MVAYISLLPLLEQCGQHDEVNQRLTGMSKSGHMSPNEVLLGNLVDQAGMLQNWTRADQLWETLVHQFGVSANCICYVADAKAHLLSGTAARAIVILDSMIDAGLGFGNGQASISHGC